MYGFTADKVSLLGTVRQRSAEDESKARPTKRRSAEDEKRYQEGKKLRDQALQQGHTLFRRAVTDVHVLRKTFRFTDEVLPAFLNYMRNPPPGPMPQELWRALTAQTVEQADDPRLSEAAFKDGYEVATQWEAVARMMQFRARRDAAEASELLIYVQAVDKPLDKCTMEKADYRKALEVVNYSSCGNRMGLLPLFIGMRVRLTEKLSAKYRLVNEAVGTVQGIEFHENEPVYEWQNNPAHAAWARGYLVLKYMPKVVYVKFDKCTENFGWGGPGVVAVLPKQALHKLVEFWPSRKNAVDPDTNKKPGMLKCKRCQLPLMPEQVRTTQTAQGMSMKRLKAYLFKGNHDDAEHWLNTYVMLSRARSMAGLLIWGLPDKELFMRGPPSFITKGLPPLEERAAREMAEAAETLRSKYPWLARALDAEKLAPPKEPSVPPTTAGPEENAPPERLGVPPVQPRCSQSEAAGGASASAVVGSMPPPTTAGRKRKAPAESLSVPPVQPRCSQSASPSAASSSAAGSEPASARGEHPGAAAVNQQGSVQALAIATLRPDEEDLEPHHLLRGQRNIFGVSVPSAGPALFSTAVGVGWKNSGNTCFVNAALQLLLRVEPLYQALRLHRCSPKNVVNCTWCCARTEAAVLRGGHARLPGGHNSFAVLARKGDLGNCFKSTSARPSPQCDAVDFLETVINRLMQEEREMDAFGGQSLSVIWELFGGILRQRKHCSAVGCPIPTRDKCEWFTGTAGTLQPWFPWP